MTSLPEPGTSFSDQYTGSIRGLFGLGRKKSSMSSTRVNDQQPLVQGAVRAMPIGVRFVLRQDLAQVAGVEDKRPVEYLAAYAADPPSVAVPDQQLELADAFTEPEHEVAGLLRDPRPGRVRRDAQDVDARPNPFGLRPQELTSGRPATARCGVEAGRL
ncbi:hypothetical protein AB0L00_38090 [Actinoallomurus sp. NPDC052308]|uniref:hypothetical protein n=1 Tax=Actinoallomurus sp. NPDC052308 TaxID=3155530 RepID=UPI003435B851